MAGLLAIIFPVITRKKKVNFSGKLCDEWEKTANQLKRPETRLVLIRTGIVLGPNGGALSQMMLPFKVTLL
jgi:NAD dependent epimerase/dehydratase family enzyme